MEGDDLTRRVDFALDQDPVNAISALSALFQLLLNIDPENKC